jgi:stage V sporulation protein R
MLNAPLENWQRDILGSIREEAYYFAPQAQTKIMNEGWASYWHSKIMTQKALKDSEIIDFADHHSGAMMTSPGQINPYKLGIELYRDIEERWDKGRFGKDWEECDDMAYKNSWDRQLGLGREKIFEVRKHYNDVTFIDEFLTPDFCAQQKMFTYDYDKKSSSWYISSRQFQSIKQKLLDSLTNFGQPLIEVVDGNYQNRGELLLVHRHSGADLREDYMQATMRNIHQIWSRPVNLQTVVEEEPKLVKFDGSEFNDESIDEL